MTPIYLQMACRFCNKPVLRIEDHSGKGIFDLYICKDCLKPIYNSTYRQLHIINKVDLLVDSIQLDEYYIIRYHKSLSHVSRSNYTIIYRDILGAIENSTDLEPIVTRKAVCEIDHILELDFTDIAALKQKLSVYTLFS